MGCCNSKNADSKATRMARWRSTGIVALRDSKLKTFPDEVLDLDKSVRTLDLTHNRLVDIPMEISKLINLQRLVLADNVIERLPLNLGKLQYLKNMSLDMNRITILPDELGQLLRIEKLSISGNLLTHLPETIGSLRNLMLLNVSNNKLEFLPESIGSCFSLEELQANGDNFYELRSPRIRTRNTHGTGCTLASCIAAELAKGSLMLSAVKVVHVVKSDSRLANNDLPVDIQRLRCRALCYSKRTSTCYT